MTMHPFKALVTLATALVPAFASAQCAGPSLMDRLSPEQRSALDSAVSAIPFPEGLIWEATRGAERVVLVGTMHVWDPRLDAIAARATPLLQDAGHALFEMTETEQSQLLQEIAANPEITVIVDGPTLPELLDEETWALLAEAAREHGIPPFMAAKMQPWFLATTLSMPACAMDAMAEGRLGLDFQLMEAAALSGTPTSALEPWDTIFTLFDAASIDEQIDLLRLSLVAPDVQDELFVAMLDGYFAGRVAEVWELNRIAMEFIPGAEADEAMLAESEALLLENRNIDWIPVIEAAVAQHGTVFVGAGAAHLPGDRGLLRLLEGNGWSIRRLDD